MAKQIHVKQNIFFHYTRIVYQYTAPQGDCGIDSEYNYLLDDSFGRIVIYTRKI